MKKSKILILLLSITTVSILALGGKEKQDIKLAAQIKDTTLEEVQEEEQKVYPSFMKELVVYNTEKNGELEVVTYGNELDHFVTVTLNDFEEYYTMEYFYNDKKISYHCHSLEDLKQMLKLHQENVNNDFKDFEDVTDGEEYKFYEFDHYYYSSQLGRKTRVNIILRKEEIASNNYSYYSEYQNQWYFYNDEEIEENKKAIAKYKKELIDINGFDIDNNIDLEYIYGRDWKCLGREQWLEMKRK